MAARLSAPPQSHNRLLEATQSTGRATVATAPLVGLQRVLDGSSSVAHFDTAAVREREGAGLTR